MATLWRDWFDGLVTCDAGMSTHPSEGCQRSIGQDAVKLLPEVQVHDRLAGSCSPAASFPLRTPDGGALDDIVALEEEDEGFIGGSRGKSRNGGHQLHAVVGGMLLASRERPLRSIGVSEDRCPSAGAGIAESGAVCTGYDRVRPNGRGRRAVRDGDCPVFERVRCSPMGHAGHRQALPIVP